MRNIIGPAGSRSLISGRFSREYGVISAKTLNLCVDIPGKEANPEDLQKLLRTGINTAEGFPRTAS
jgi:hypothetical protein